MNFLAKIFGDSNSREIKKLWRYVEEVNSYEERMEELEEEDFPRYTEELREKLHRGETLDYLLPEAFALVREAAKRRLGMRPFDVQVLGAVVLHQGRISEMKTGEGKTLVATMPAYLNALTGKSVHIVTVNDYLAKRDREWMGPVYEMLGLSVGAVLHDMKKEDRRNAYSADIVYGTNNEFGFDFLRDNMVMHKEELAQRDHHFAIVDEVDSILIDEARTPLIISGFPQQEAEIYERWKKPVENIIKKQRRQVKDVLKEAEEKIKEEQYEEAAEILYLAKLGGPKDEELLELVKEPGISKRMERVKQGLTEARKHFLKEHLYFTIDEVTGVVDISSKGYEILAEEDPQLKRFLGFDREETEETQEEEEVLSPAEAEESPQGEDSFEKGGEHESIIRTMLKAYSLFKKDVDYVVRDGEVVIVDEFTGRLMHGRRYSEGLHQAIEAKEGVDIKGRTRTIASITLQNYFRMYEKLAGMTGTAATEEEEFRKIYSMDVVNIPTNKPLHRKELPDAVYRTAKGKFNAVVEEIEECYSRGQPVLVGTISIEKSELLSKMLQQKGIPHNVLNAKHHEREAEIIAQAGSKGAVTISTNMAGRGTDIILGGNPDPEIENLRNNFELSDEEKKSRIDRILSDWQARHDEVVELGGLHIIGTERHESRRIDNQLRGRAGRQGDPGSSQFFVSLEDDLLRLFGSESVSNIMERVGMDDDVPVEHSMISRAIENAQRKVEGRNFEIRKQLLEYDDVINKQREVIYQQRREVLEGENLRERVMSMIDSLIDKSMDLYANEKLHQDEWDLGSLTNYCEKIFLPKDRFKEEELREMSYQELRDLLRGEAHRIYELREEELGVDVMRELERVILLRIVDRKWMDHIDNMHELRQGVGLRAIGQQDPLMTYRYESAEMFKEMIHSIQEDVVRLLFHVKVGEEPRREQTATPVLTVKNRPAGAMEEGRRAETGEEESSGQGGGKQKVKQQPVTVNKVGRNEPCPCGSGKKYKKCCGAA